MFSAASVCLPVCLFACQHDNFRTTKRRMLKLGGYVHCTKISPEYECQGQRSRSPGTKKKVRHFWERSFVGGAVTRRPVLHRRENERMLSIFVSEPKMIKSLEK